MVIYLHRHLRWQGLSNWDRPIMKWLKPRHLIMFPCQSCHSLCDYSNTLTFDWLWFIIKNDTTKGQLYIHFPQSWDCSPESGSIVPTTHTPVLDYATSIVSSHLTYICFFAAYRIITWWMQDWNTKSTIRIHYTHFLWINNRSSWWRWWCHLPFGW